MDGSEFTDVCGIYVKNREREGGMGSGKVDCFIRIRDVVKSVFPNMEDSTSLQRAEGQN